MAVVQLTQQMLDDGLEFPPGKKRAEICCSVTPGLYAEVRSVNPANPTWYFRYKDANGKTCHTRIGAVRDIPLAEAKRRAKTLRAEITLGADPAAALKAQREVMTVKAFIDQKYLPHAENRLRSYRNIKQMAGRIVVKFGNLRLNQLSRSMLQTFVNDLRNEGLAPATCDRHAALLKAALNLAVEWDLIKTSPADKLKLFRVDNRIERYMSEEELGRLLTVLRTDKNRMVANLMLFLVSTGARLNEALHARWEHIDTVNGVWRIPAANSKSKRVRSAPLGDSALEVLSQLKTQNRGEFLFINNTTKKRLTCVKTVWDRLRKAADLPQLRIHDLRHQYASMLVNSGRTLYEVQQILGHSDPSVTQRYSHLSASALKDAANSASEKIAQAGKKAPPLRLVS